MKPNAHRTTAARPPALSVAGLALALVGCGQGIRPPGPETSDLSAAPSPTTMRLSPTPARDGASAAPATVPALPAIDRRVQEHLETATFALG